jgi:hypothetical protein
MSDNNCASGNRETLLENSAAELTNAAYAVALRHGVEDNWLNLELELWEAMKEAVKKWEQGSPRSSAMPFVSDWV